MGDLDNAAYVMYPLAVSALSSEGTTNLGYDETHIIAHGHGKSGDIHIHAYKEQAGRQAGIDAMEKQCFFHIKNHNHSFRLTMYCSAP